MGGRPQHVCSRVGGRGRHWALRCHGVAVRARRRVRAVPDLHERTLALRTAPGSDRSPLPVHVRRPYTRSKDAAVTQDRHRRPRRGHFAARDRPRLRVHVHTSPAEQGWVPRASVRCWHRERGAQPAEGAGERGRRAASNRRTIARRAGKARAGRARRYSTRRGACARPRTCTLGPTSSSTRARSSRSPARASPTSRSTTSIPPTRLAGYGAAHVERDQATVRRARGPRGRPKQPGSNRRCRYMNRAAFHPGRLVSSHGGASARRSIS
jgi:hypothetical protein